MARSRMSQALDDSSALGLDTLEQFATYEDYLDSQVSEIWMSEEVLAAGPEVKERVRIVWVLSQVRLLSRYADAPWRYEVTWRIRDWFSAPNHVEI